MPQPLEEAVQAKLGPMAARGNPFNFSDNITDSRLPQQQLTFIWHKDNRWVLATVHGGMGFDYPLYSFDYQDGRASFVEETFQARDGAICGSAARMLQGKVTDTPK